MSQPVATKHTPGPWEYDSDNRTIHRDGQIVAESVYQDDANLIRAAPEMYTALVDLSYMAAKHHRGRDWDRAIGAATQAIYMARGEL